MNTKLGKCLALVGVLAIVAVAIFFSLVSKGDEDEKENSDDIKTGVTTWYFSDGSTLSTYEFGDDGKVKQTTIDLWTCEKEEDSYSYSWKDDTLSMYPNGKKQSFEVTEQEDGLHLTMDIGYEMVYYSSFEKATESNEGYKYTTYALKEQSDENGWVIDGGVLIGYIGEETEVTVPQDVEEIAEGAFAADIGRGVNLNKVTIGGNVKKIQARAFAFTQADYIVIEEGVEELGEYCFMDSYIEEIYFPESVKTIGDVIMETEEGLDGTKIHCVKESEIAKYFEENMPYGDAELVYN